MMIAAYVVHHCKRNFNGSYESKVFTMAYESEQAANEYAAELLAEFPDCGAIVSMVFVKLATK